MENLLGLLRIHVTRGIDLAIRDIRSSDPYVVVKMGKQVLHMFSCTRSCVSLFHFLHHFDFLLLFSFVSCFWIGLEFGYCDF
jgi:hypothetical protein